MVTAHSLVLGDPYLEMYYFTLNALFLYTLELFGGRESSSFYRRDLKNVLFLCGRC